MLLTYDMKNPKYSDASGKPKSLQSFDLQDFNNVLVSYQADEIALTVRYYTKTKFTCKLVF
jgi:hypothetical protein